MSSNVSSSGPGQLTSEYWLSRRDHLFMASCIALIVTAMSFAIRGALIQPLAEQFNLTKEQLGWIISTAFWGFTLSQIIGGPLCDVLGMGRLLVLAFIGHLIGIFLTVFATGFWTLFFSTLAFGLGNGFVEAACNPLVPTLYPDQKIKRLNLFHTWFPGGIVIGGLVAYGISHIAPKGIAGINSWQLQMLSMLIPLAIYAAMFVGRKFPASERTAAGVSTGAMYKECTQPLFLLFVFCMLMTAVTELGPNQWIGNIVGNLTGIKGDAILYLVWITGLMAVGRSFAGPIIHSMPSPVMVLMGSAFFSGIGLFMISQAHSATTAAIAATIFAVGVCFFWPTMLGVVSEKFPKSGALGLAIMGGAGMLASSFGQPIIGAKYDKVSAEYVQANAATWEPSVEKWIGLNIQVKDPKKQHDWKMELAEAKSNPAKSVSLLANVVTVASSEDVKDNVQQSQLAKPAIDVKTASDSAGGAAALKQLVFLPAILFVLFTGIYLYDKSKGGYQKELLHQNQ